MSIAKAIWAVTLAAEKKRKLHQVMKARTRGMVVICDRWPQMQFRVSSTGRGCSTGRTAPPWQRRLAKYELAPYELARRFPPDLVIRLDVDVDTAAARRTEDSREYLAHRIDLVRVAHLRRTRCSARSPSTARNHPTRCSRRSSRPSGRDSDGRAMGSRRRALRTARRRGSRRSRARSWRGCAVAGVPAVDVMAPLGPSAGRDRAVAPQGRDGGPGRARARTRGDSPPTSGCAAGRPTGGTGSPARSTCSWCGPRCARAAHRDRRARARPGPAAGVVVGRATGRRGPRPRVGRGRRPDARGSRRAGRRARSTCSSPGSPRRRRRAEPGRGPRRRRAAGRAGAGGGAAGCALLEELVHSSGSRRPRILRVDRADPAAVEIVREAIAGRGDTGGASVAGRTTRVLVAVAAVTGLLAVPAARPAAAADRARRPRPAPSPARRPRSPPRSRPASGSTRTGPPGRRPPRCRTPSTSTRRRTRAGTAAGSPERSRSPRRGACTTTRRGWGSAAANVTIDHPRIFNVGDGIRDPRQRRRVHDPRTRTSRTSTTTVWRTTGS